MKIEKVYQEALPAVKLIGKRFTNEDRKDGTFAHLWGRSCAEGWFDVLDRGKTAPGVVADRIGAMRGSGDAFEYWIGTLLASDAEVPPGFDSVDLPAGGLFVCWLSGNPNNGELYGEEAWTLFLDALRKEGLTIFETNWTFERYNAPRFTEPDRQGNVVLDFCVLL